MFKRADKVGEAIHELVSELLVKGLKDPRIGFVTVTGVKVSDDLHHATVFFTAMGDEEAKKASAAGLNSARGFIRSEMGKRFRMKYVPEVVFKYDSSVDYGNRIDNLLREIHVHDEEGDDRADS